VLDGMPGVEIEDGVVQVGQHLMTGHRGVFAGGDMIPASRTVTVAIGPLELARRIMTFDAGAGGLDETATVYEARRCLSCGNCFECGTCFGVCPDNAVIELASATKSTLTTARAAASVPPSARAVPSRCSPRRSELRYPTVVSRTTKAVRPVSSGPRSWVSRFCHGYRGGMGREQTRSRPSSLDESDI
jgi:NAD-dependent dihydropyrimidine dehydrogenase PreA subunit